MKKIFFLPLLLCIPLLLLSCAEECGHNHLSARVVEPTCDKEGYTANTCVDCNAEFKSDYILPTGHTITETVFAPTCADVGYTYYSCPCGYNYRSDYTPPTGHSYTETIHPVSCESAGYTEYTCAVCDHTYKGNFVDTEGHKLSTEIVLPTEESVGYTRYTCDICKEYYDSDFVFFSDVYGSGYTDNTTVVARGIDVSVYQHTPTATSYKPLNWDVIKAAGIDFAILKAGSKKSGMDPVFEMNYADAKAAGLDLGAYFYCYATTEDELMEELSLLLDWLEGKQFEYPIYFDLEDPSLEKPENKEMLTKFCFLFVDTLRDNGYYGALYSNNTWLTEYLYGETVKAYCDVWYARYQTTAQATLEDTFIWNNEKYGNQLGMWQYSSTGIIPNSGILKNQTVDLNYAYKDYPSIIKKYGFNGYSANIMGTETAV